MRLLIVCVGAALLLGCHQKQPKFSDAQIADLRKVVPGMSQACLDKLKWGGIEAFQPKGHECERMTPLKRWSGLWRNDFETWRFCAAPARECTQSSPGMYVHLEMEPPPRGWTDTPPGGLYAIEFLGRETVLPDFISGRAMQRMVVDRLTSIKMVEPPSKGQMTKEHVQGYLKDCARAKLCMPNTELSAGK